MGIINFLIPSLVPVIYRFRYSRNSWHILSDLQSYCKSKTSVSESSTLFYEWAFPGNFGTRDQNIRQLNSVHCMPWVTKKIEILVTKDSLIWKGTFLMDFSNKIISNNLDIWSCVTTSAHFKNLLTSRMRQSRKNLFHIFTF